jgi:hypothetical protein
VSKQRVGLGSGRALCSLSISVEICGVKPAFEVRRVLFWRSLPSHTHTDTGQRDVRRKDKKLPQEFLLFGRRFGCCASADAGAAGFFSLSVNFSYFHPPARRKVIVLEIGAGSRRNNLFRLRSLTKRWNFAALFGVLRLLVFGGKKHLTLVTRRLTVWNCEFLGFCKRAHRVLSALRGPRGQKIATSFSSPPD